MEIFIQKLTTYKNLIFLLMCAGVHVFNIVLFGALGVYPLMWMNVGSAGIYAIILFLHRGGADELKLIVAAYIEIMVFSTASEFVASTSLGYICFSAGMLAVIFSLASELKRKRAILQFLGIIFTSTIYYINNKPVVLFPAIAKQLEPYDLCISVVNLAIALITVLYVSYLYTVELEITREKLDYNINHDTLTGLFNRHYFETFVRLLNLNDSEKPFSIAMLDVDNFKRVNDTYGHDAGDKVLKMVSCVISDSIGENVAPVRWGGEEFILFIPGRDGSGAAEIAERIRSGIENSVVKANHTEIKVTITIGIATGYQLTDYQAIIRRADELLYKGKHNGKNQVVLN